MRLGEALIVKRKVFSPIGELIAEVSPAGIRSLRVAGEIDIETPARFQSSTCSDILDLLASQLESYFAGELRVFSVPLDLSHHGSAFARRVWQSTLEIPYGSRRTYGQLAKKIGHPKAFRSVGTALRLNPVLLLIPCHRVVRSGGIPGRFSAGTETKKFLLAHEQRVVEKDTRALLFDTSSASR